MKQLVMRRPNLDDLPPKPPLPLGHRVRLARAEDADGIAEVLGSAFGPEWTVERVRQALLEAPDVESSFLVVGKAPVATASARLLPEQFPGSGYVHWVGTHAAHLGRGYGRAVTVAVLARFQELGCRDAVLETDTFRLPAIRLYLGLGFRPEPIVPEHEMTWREILIRVGVDLPGPRGQMLDT